MFSAAAAQGVINATVHANMTAIVVLSMVFTPIMLIAYGKWIEPRLADASGSLPDEEIHEQQPVMIIGMGRFGQIVSDLLRMCGYALTIIDRDSTTVAGMNQYGVKT